MLACTFILFTEVTKFENKILLFLLDCVAFSYSSDAFILSYSYFVILNDVFRIIKTNPFLGLCGCTKQDHSRVFVPKTYKVRMAHTVSPVFSFIPI